MMNYTQLYTNRLILKPITKEDDQFIFEHFSNEHVTKYLYDNEPVKNMEEAYEILGFYLGVDPYIQNRWIIIDKNTNQKIGTCGFHKRIKENKSIDLGYDLKKEFWRKGYMTEVLIEVFKYAKENLDIEKISAEISIDNIASINLLKKLGFIEQESYYIEFKGEKLLHSKYELVI